jgi:hypothetical protein
MNALLFLLLLAICPSMMFFMMRGMHGGGDVDAGRPRASTPQVCDTPAAREARIADLEREGTRLREAGDEEAEPDPAFYPVGSRR